MREFVPEQLRTLPGSDAVGRVFALYDHDIQAEVLGTLIACWPDRGPTWAVRLHDLDADRRPVVVFLYERPESKLGRWFVCREVPMSRAERYQRLVEARKAYDSEGVFGLANPSVVNGGEYDSNEVGPWTRWGGDLNADLMVVGQDWGDIAYFTKNRGFDASANSTNLALAGLLASVGRPLTAPPAHGNPREVEHRRGSGVFLTNALLWLKQGGLSAAVNESWFSGDSLTFLSEQIAIVQPRVIVALGQQAYRALLRAYDLPVPRGRFRDIVEMADGLFLPASPNGARLYAVYHCGARVRNTLRSLDQQHHDWDRVARALRSGSNA